MRCRDAGAEQGGRAKYPRFIPQPRRDKLRERVCATLYDDTLYLSLVEVCGDLPGQCAFIGHLDIYGAVFETFFLGIIYYPLENIFFWPSI